MAALHVVTVCVAMVNRKKNLLTKIAVKVANILPGYKCALEL